MIETKVYFCSLNSVLPYQPLGQTGQQSWAEQDSELQRLWLTGETVSQIASYLNRSKSAILTRAARMGLPRRAAPGRKSSKTTSIPKIIGFVPAERIRKIVSSNQNQQQTKKPLVVFQSRMCLCCGNSFASEGSHNRICSKCKESQRYRNAG